MRHPLLPRFILLYTLCAVMAGCNSEETEVIFPSHERLPKSVVEIEEVTNGYIGTHRFTYDTQGRVTEYIRIDNLGKIVSKFYQKYFFRGNAVTVTRRYEESSELDMVARLHLDQLRRTVSIEQEQTTKRMYYNADGYFTERQNDDGWVEYLYTAAEKGFNLAVCNIYERRIENMEQRPASSETRTYSDVANNLSIDLSYLLTGSGTDLYDQLLALSMVDLLGQRSTNLPDKREVTDYTLDGETNRSYLYVYQHNEAGYITQVDMTQEPEGYLTTFTLSYN